MGKAADEILPRKNPSEMSKLAPKKMTDISRSLGILGTKLDI